MSSDQDRVDIFANIESSTPAHVDFISDPKSGLRAVIVLHDLTLGPAVGGIRTLPYPSTSAALADALQLAQAMTEKCALADLDAGGGKCVVIDHDDWDREQGFVELGRRINHWQGQFCTAGDLGTRAADLRRAAAECAWVHLDNEALMLADAVGQTVRAGIRAGLAMSEDADLQGVRVGIQGAGTIGSAVAKVLTEASAQVLIGDLDPQRALDLAAAVGGQVLNADSFPAWDVDVLAPCAIGSVLTMENANQVRARVVAGGANHILADDEVGRALQARNVVVVPDSLSSSGAVIRGVCATVMKIGADRFLQRVYATTSQVLLEAASGERTPAEIARARAVARLGRGR